MFVVCKGGGGGGHPSTEIKIPRAMKITALIACVIGAVILCLCGNNPQLLWLAVLVMFGIHAVMATWLCVAYRKDKQKFLENSKK